MYIKASVILNYTENTAIQKHWFISSFHPFSLFSKRLKDGRGGRMKRKGGMMKVGEGNGGRIKERKVNGKRIKGRKGK